jgi:hypothetical protein
MKSRLGILLLFEDGSRWYSEPLLGSRLRPRRRGDTAGEGFTHADGLIGHFRVRTTVAISNCCRRLTS